MQKIDRSERNSLILAYAVLGLILLLVLLPILIIIIASFKEYASIAKDFPLKLPNPFTAENYNLVFVEGKLPLAFMNSMILVVSSLVINLAIGTTSAYAINRFDFMLKKFVLLLFLLGMIMPQFITEISRFQIISALGLSNKLLAPILIYSASDLIQLYIYTQFLDKLPKSVDESAMIDGCGYFGVYWRFILPLLMPATATVAIIKAVDVINDMYVPYLYMPSAKLATLTTALMRFSTGKFANWATTSAAIVVVMIPTIIIYLIFQKYIFEGIVAGTVKE